MKEQKQEQPLFIQCANGNYPILINPNPSFAEQLHRLKAGVYELKYGEFNDRLKFLLNEIIERKCLYNSESLRYFIRMRKSMAYIVKNGRLTEEWKDYEAYPGMLTPVIISLIDFLLDSKKVKKIKKCLICDEFFIASSAAREVKCYSVKCDKAFKQYTKWRQRDDEPVNYGPRKTDVYDPAYERLKEYWLSKV